MPELRITSPRDLGPLTLQLLTARGQTLPPPEMLTSQRREVTVEAPAGDYVVIATRPNGQTITSEVTVTPTVDGGRCDISVDVNSPNEFMYDATDRGLVPGTNPQLRDSVEGSASQFQFTYRVGVSGDAGRALTALAAAPSASTAITSVGSVFQPASRRAGPDGLWRADSRSYVAQSFAPDASPEAPKSLWLRRWIEVEGHWRPHQSDVSFPEINIGRGYVRVYPKFYGSMYGGPTCAVGLVDEDGFGPVVVVPPFTDGMDVVFLADGLAASSVANRISNPSAVKVPVALALPRNTVFADLLSALNAASLPGAEQLLSGDAGLGSADYAFRALWDKQKDYGAATLGAHYLLRFMPKRIPIEWLENLMRIRPEIADGPTLLAARYIAVGGKQGAEVSGGEIRDLLRESLRRPIHLFARSRSLLAQSIRAYGPRFRSRKLEVIHPRRPRPTDFLDVAAGAGGVDAHWGFGPGRLEGNPRWLPGEKGRLPQVEMHGGLFFAPGEQS